MEPVLCFFPNKATFDLAVAAEHHKWITPKTVKLPVIYCRMPLRRQPVEIRAVRVG